MNREKGIDNAEYLNIVAKKVVMVGGVFERIFFEPISIDKSIVIKASLTLIIAGTLAGLFPARKAVMIRPIEALRAD